MTLITILQPGWPHPQLLGKPLDRNRIRDVMTVSPPAQLSPADIKVSSKGSVGETIIRLQALEAPIEFFNFLRQHSISLYSVFSVSFVSSLPGV